MEGYMIKQVIKHNIDHRVITKACEILRNDGIIACPTDTNWSLFAHIDSKIAIKKLKNLKGGINTFVFTLVCSSLSTIIKPYRNNEINALLRKETQKDGKNIIRPISFKSEKE